MQHPLLLLGRVQPGRVWRTGVGRHGETTDWSRSMLQVVFSATHVAPAS